MNTIQNSTQNRIIAPICLGIALLIAIFFLRPFYVTYIDKTATFSSLEKNKITLEKEYKELQAIKDNTASTLSDLEKGRITKIAKKFDTSDIMSVVLLNDFTKDSADNLAPITISSISVNKGKKLPNGLSIGTVSIAIQGKTLADIIAYITSLTQDAPYVFTLDNISLPIDTDPEQGANENYGLGIDLGVYYYE